jgi:hypothetical protein
VSPDISAAIATHSKQIKINKKEKKKRKKQNDYKNGMQSLPRGRV